MGRSVGSPTAGHLLGGARLADAPYLRIAPAYAHGDVRGGLGSLVAMVDRAAQRVRKAYPNAVLNVGHLSRPGGGEVDRHVSHESGRDVDIGFYVRSAQDKPLASDHFVPFQGDGTAKSWPGAFFDDARNWALVRALLTDGQAHVTHIFVAAPLRARLLAYAAKSGASRELRDRAALAMLQPKGALPHDDHFHVRISCPPWQRECVEVPVRKKPALVAKVPIAHGRARAHAAATADRDEPRGPARGLATPPPSARLHAAQKPEPTSGSTFGALFFGGEPAAAAKAVEAPAEPSHGDADEKSTGASPIDDVDGPM